MTPKCLSFLKDLSDKLLTKQLKPHTLKNHSDEQIIEELTAVKGIGVWTAEMFLMFAMGRPDIFSYGDLGLRRGLEKIYRIKKPLSPAQAEKITNKWIPYRTVGSLYLWHAKDSPDSPW